MYISRFDWYKCTECCNADGQYDICAICYDNLYHNEHGNSISHFTMKPGTCGSDCFYCDACGTLFEKAGTNIYHCKECEKGRWNFDLCSMCYGRKLHPHHRQHIEKKKMLQNVK